MSESRQTELLEHVFAQIPLLSTATKPTSGIGAGQEVFEYDTGRIFVYTGTAWVFKRNPEHLFSVTTIDLNQAAGDYDLFTAGSSAAQILEFGLIIPADLTGTAAGVLTAISVQTTDDTPFELVSASTGAKANLSENAHLLYSGGEVLASTKKIQLTIVGGATTAEQVCNTWVKYQEVY